MNPAFVAWRAAGCPEVRTCGVRGGLFWDADPPSHRHCSFLMWAEDRGSYGPWCRFSPTQRDGRCAKHSDLYVRPAATLTRKRRIEDRKRWAREVQVAQYQLEHDPIDRATARFIADMLAPLASSG
jgi:hypothetical protein